MIHGRGGSSCSPLGGMERECATIPGRFQPRRSKEVPGSRHGAPSGILLAPKQTLNHDDSNRVSRTRDATPFCRRLGPMKARRYSTLKAAVAEPSLIRGSESSGAGVREPRPKPGFPDTRWQCRATTLAG